MLMFPKLALGLSGFETGVAVMPLVRGDPSDTAQSPAGRVRNARLLLGTAALYSVVSVFLIVSSIVTTVLIPAPLFQDGGEANGRALAYLAHTNLGSPIHGTVYDISTILILWFAGASAIAGLLSLVPKYLPRYGMAPSWAAAIPSPGRFSLPWLHSPSLTCSKRTWTLRRGHTRPGCWFSSHRLCDRGDGVHI